MGRVEHGITTCKKATELSPRFLPAFWVLALMYSSEGRVGEASSAVKNILKIQPGLSAKDFQRIMPVKTIDKIYNGLQKDGLTRDE